jgi:hypothetical protein
MKTVRAHYDGEKILLDESLALRPNSTLLVTLLEDYPEASDNDIEQSALNDLQQIEYVSEEELKYYLQLK